MSCQSLLRLAGQCSAPHGIQRNAVEHGLVARRIGEGDILKANVSLHAPRLAVRLHRTHPLPAAHGSYPESLAMRPMETNDSDICTIRRPRLRSSQRIAAVLHRPCTCPL